MLIAYQIVNNEIDLDLQPVINNLALAHDLVELTEYVANTGILDDD